LLGGAAASPELIRRCVEQGVPVSTTYGLTEAASQVATSLPSEVVSKPGSVGKSLMFTSVHIVDERGHSLPEGEYGEIVVTGPTIMKEYYNDPESTAQALRNAELHTGDIGYLDSDGDLWIVQRRSDLIISGGENIYPAELEQIMKLHPAIQDVCVVGIEDNEWGQRVSAAIVLRDGASLTTDEITAFCRQSLAGYKVPRTIKFVAELPRTASGKIERVVVKDFFR
jgi:O-succinylbenzoic acid--CoA ligase